MGKYSTRGSGSKFATMMLAVVVVAALSFGALAGCSSGGGSNGSSSNAPSTESSRTKTLVKTATNEMTLVDWGVSAKDSPLTVSSDDPKYADYIATLGEFTGFDIESLTMQVEVTEFAGAEIGATHENVTDNTYTIKSLEAVVDGETIAYTEGDFKKK
ncbi:MAG: hypothetical protein RR547_02630 [Raoultibacter sp.]